MDLYRMLSSRERAKRENFQSSSTSNGLGLSLAVPIMRLNSVRFLVERPLRPSSSMKMYSSGTMMPFALA